MFLRRMSIVYMAVLLSSGIIFSEEKITIITEDSPPLNYEENNIAKGPSVEIVQEILNIINLEEDIQFFPWARGYSMATEEPNIALFSATKTEERDKIFKWVGPLAVKEKVFFVKKGSNIKITDFEDAKKYNIGVLREGSTEQLLISKNFPNIDSVTSEDLNLKKIIAGRIDVWYTSKSTAVSSANKLNIDINEITDIYTVKRSVLYIAFNNKTSDEVITKWQDAYDLLEESGKIKEIYKKYSLDFMYPGK